jgi:hypothetical protein
MKCDAYYANWKCTQCNYVDTKHKQMKLSKGNENAMWRAIALSQNTNVTRLQREWSKKHKHNAQAF